MGSLDGPSALGLLPLRLEVEHLDALEGLALRADQAMLSMKPAAASLQTRWQAQVDARFAALALDRDRSVREALLRLQSPQFSTARTAAWALGTTNSESCCDFSGRIILRSRCRGAVLDGLARTAHTFRACIDDPSSIELAALGSDIAEGVLFASLASSSCTSGLLAAGCSTHLPRWSLPIIQRHAFCGTGPEQALALYALGRSAVRTDPATHRAWVALVDVVLGDRLFDNAAAVLVMSVVGGRATARRIATRLRDGASEQALASALGRLGVVGEALILVELMTSPDQGLARAAVRALFMMTGRLFAREPVRDDGLDLEPDRTSADAFIRACAAPDVGQRLHLGLPIRADVVSDVPSFRTLRDALFGRSTHLLRRVFCHAAKSDLRRAGGAFFNLLQN